MRDASYLSPPTVGRLLGVKPAKVLAWIRRGELPAVNIADRRGGRPRWRISREALDAFLSARTSRPAPKVTRTRRRRDAAVTEYF